MNEKKLAENFSKEIEKLIEGINGPNKIEVNNDYEDELILARCILHEDFSIQSHIKEDLKKRLLTKFNDNKNCSRQQREYSFDEDELSEEELDYAAGGHSLKEGSACAKCGCKRNRATITTATCPDCGHSRDEHL